MNAKIRKLLAIMVGVLCSLTAMFALAGQWNGRAMIGKIIIQDDQTVLIFKESGAWKNPDLCDNGAKIVLLPPGAEGSAAAYKEVYASLLAAHLTSREINAFVDGCTLFGNKTYPVLTRVAML